MDDDSLFAALTKFEIKTDAAVNAWIDSADLSAALDVIGRGGSSAPVKMDGGRAGASVYAVVVSGGRLREGTDLRKDGPDLRPLLREALAFYARSVESKEPFPG